MSENMALRSSTNHDSRNHLEYKQISSEFRKKIKKTEVLCRSSRQSQGHYITLTVSIIFKKFTFTIKALDLSLCETSFSFVGTMDLNFFSATSKKIEKLLQVQI